ncbi:hypothetical protein A3E97_03915 [Candidatus Uhrbacteria bacterium RIFCSPHIGHO2_12_FULL_47_12]|uniref:Uncharacterized protein n=1 Tax=Candidatus Uhrbacteria bacterium RIFCSPLOWO2_02_FULL_48_18 TaxID=1802408 RepID=A0A1F7V9K8_9BACT|nr:MAG: hypothetical protein A2839_03525 [Candidatus Uhrbacteria bacterium RIFCSPHIGHO2_01_FULL_47_10]OGL75842.1 MAG: hypothetical protein A3E97_03915 [Candidatus Uhrbacteria bacterium RIFCSPHIGHO2_12_FULL_47_12]OGL81941.1 MAG: hypothetical protein A3B20_02560 [Candidatus Uhrbacteria bacterium RIFCSPLOWO2_01_FULL_47_17]OGL87105.1 MAG: hypothetical protein A3I41_04155 [Candidatus Uhrbacteria bacterium RIFCSPLOWO2_02_FULL_48_18]OGL93680.1 MAG: hypothetical protein A3H12_03460 [Candidatus Uhrbacte
MTKRISIPTSWRNTGVLAFLVLMLFLLFESTHANVCALNKNYAYKAPSSSAIYFITETCTKRAFTNEMIFFTYFPSWGHVEAAPTLLLKKIPNDALGFMPYGPLYDPQYGALVKTVTDPKVYLLLDGKKYWITSEMIFTKLRYRWNWIEDVDSRLLLQYQSGGEITETHRHLNGTLIKYEGDPAVYRLEDQNGKQVKRHIASEEVFKSLKFRSDRIITISQDESYPDGSPISEKIVQSPSQADPSCVKNITPVFTHHLVDPKLVTNIVPPPNIHKASGHLKTHSYLNTTSVGIPIYAPVDMSLFNGAHYVGGPYSLDFRVSCEVRLRLAHIDPVQKIKDALPKEAKLDSKDTAVNPPITFKAGEVIAYIYQDVGVLSVGLDFGVYHQDRPNRYASSTNPEILQSVIYTRAVCPYEFFTKELNSSYRSKFDLIGQEGLVKDGVSFCD